jgi:hypothetical protein
MLACAIFLSENLYGYSNVSKAFSATRIYLGMLSSAFSVTLNLPFKNHGKPLGQFKTARFPLGCLVSKPSSAGFRLREAIG